MRPSEDLKAIFRHDSHFQDLMLQLLESSLEHAFDGIMICEASPGFPIVFVNAAFTTLTGFPSAEVLGRSPALLQGPMTDGRVLERLRRDLDAGRIFHGEAVNYRKDGSQFIMEWKIAPIRDAHQRISHYLAIQRDVTAWRNP